MPLRATFATVASLYDEVWPGYPDVIIDAIVDLARLPAEGRILEVGCGSGQITRPFARRGYAMLALELGPALAALAAEHLHRARARLHDARHLRPRVGHARRGVDRRAALRLVR